MKRKAKIINMSEKYSNLVIIHLQNAEQVVGSMRKTILHISIALYSLISFNITLNLVKMKLIIMLYHIIFIKWIHLGVQKL